MDVINLIDLKLKSLYNTTYTSSSEKFVNSDIKYLITMTLLKLNGFNNLSVFETDNIRSFENLEIKLENKLYKIDINTHDVEKVISLPSLMSIKRAKDFLSNYNNFITYIFVDYKMLSDNDFEIVNIQVQNIETLDWSYLSIQNLGKGQLQMKNISDKLTFNNNITRREWLSLLNHKGSEYYNNLLLKITEYKSKWEEEY